MAETYPYPVEGCDHAPFKTVQALAISEVATRRAGEERPNQGSPHRREGLYHCLTG